MQLRHSVWRLERRPLPGTENLQGGTMSGEIIAILAVGVALAGLILTSLKGTETRLREGISQLRGDMKQLGERVSRLEHSQAKLEGLLEGLREAITGRAAAR